tara:strand:- start:2675 stop:2779 length:105 start_codon:yes stop_codon:yes gene_type:complete
MTNRPYSNCKKPHSHGRVIGEAYCRVCKKMEEEE